MKIKEIETVLRQTPMEELEEQLEYFRQDQRSGVQKLVERFEKKRIQYNAVLEEWQAKEAFDEAFGSNRHVLVGIDEVGRGPLAGPVVAAAVILPRICRLEGLKDSKKLTEEKRKWFYNEIHKQAIAIGVGIVEADEIDEINILQATFKAMRKALEDLDHKYEIICVDGNMEIPGAAGVQHTVIKGDDKSASIAAASVIAKVTRDEMMIAYHKDYPQYDWIHNKGYGSAKHYEAIQQHGITPLHRKTFLKKEGYR